MKHEICVVLPAYNEARTIKDSIVRFATALPTAYIIVIDNNSNDGTGQIAIDTIVTNKLLGEVSFVQELGKGNALSAVLPLIEADAVVICDSDLTYPIAIVPEFIDFILEGSADMVTADRLSNGSYRAQNRRRFHELGNNLINRMANCLFGSQYTDLATGLRVLSRKFLDSYQINAKGFEFELDISIHAAQHNFTVLEMPIFYQQRPEGSESKLRTYHDGALYVVTLISRFIKARYING